MIRLLIATPVLVTGRALETCSSAVTHIGYRIAGATHPSRRPS